MKKAISLLAALATAASISVTAFAADEIPGTLTENNVASIEPRSGDWIEPRVGISTEEGTKGQIIVGPGELFLVDQSEKVITELHNKLDPGTEYKFDIYWNPNVKTTRPTLPDPAAVDKELVGTDSEIITQSERLTETILDKGTIRLRAVRGDSGQIQSARIATVRQGAQIHYQLVINTRDSYGVKINDVEYSLSVTGSSAPAGAFKDSSHTFRVGYEAIRDDETNIGEGGTITISNDFPVITKDQFAEIAKSVNYKAVKFAAQDGGWFYTGRVSGMASQNFHYSYDVIPALINKYPDQDYKFLTFNAGVTFPATGEMRIDVSDIYDSFDGEMFTYLYRNGKLTTIDTTYDSGSNEIVFRTNHLGSFVITDTKITDTSIVDEPDETEDNTDDDEDETGAGEGSGNPNTGASPMMNVAVTLGLATLVTAGAISRRRK